MGLRALFSAGCAENPEIFGRAAELLNSITNTRTEQSHFGAVASRVDADRKHPPYTHEGREAHVATALAFPRLGRST